MYEIFSSMGGRAVIVNVDDATKVSTLYESYANSEEAQKAIVNIGEDLSHEEHDNIVRSAFRKMFAPRTEEFIPYDERPFITEIYNDFLVTTVSSVKYRVPYTLANSEVTFTPRNEWQKVEMEVVNVGEIEGDEQYSILGEYSDLKAASAIFGINVEVKDLSEMHADIVLAEPGFGNPKDKHYYPPEMLKRDAHVFEGTKMYTTNHAKGEHNVRNWVATVVEAGKRFTETGAPILKAAIHRTSFAEDLKNLNESGLLNKMAVSMLAVGKARKGKVDGKSANIVEAITKAKAVDFVKSAGAGGYVNALVESFVDEGDVDLLTTQQLKERRPDLYASIRGSDEHTISELQGELSGKTKSAPQEVINSNNMNELEEYKTKLAETEAKLNKAEAKLAEQDQAVLRAEAKALVASLGIQEEFALPGPSIVRMAERATSHAFVEGEDVKETVTAWLKDEAKYISSIRKPVTTTKVVGLGEGDGGDGAPVPPVPASTFEETDKRINEVLASFGKRGLSLNTNNTLLLKEGSDA